MYLELEKSQRVEKTLQRVMKWDFEKRVSCEKLAGQIANTDISILLTSNAQLQVHDR
jgi:hypothetical protein